MKSPVIIYSFIFILSVFGFILVSCGSDNSGIVANINPTNNPSDIINPTPTPILISKPVQGYMYVTSSVTEEGENIEDINILDVPAFQPDSSGNEPLVSQVFNSLKQDYPEDWAKPEIQELYNQLNSTLSQSKPLPEYNSSASVYSIYQDSISDTPIPVTTNGYFNNSVLTGA